MPPECVMVIVQSFTDLGKVGVEAAVGFSLWFGVQAATAANKIISKITRFKISPLWIKHSKKRRKRQQDFNRKLIVLESGLR